MSAVTASLCSTLIFLGVFVFLSAGNRITAESGQNVTLSAQASNNKIVVVKWRRTDQQEEYVLLYQDDNFDPDQQHISFKNRVDLQDRKMKDGDVSLILSNVTTDDTGTYECGVVMKGAESFKVIIVIHLVVVPPDQKTIITADSGQTITLTCRAPNNNIISVEWNRADLGYENVLLYQDGHLFLEDQHSSFKNRVDLHDRQMKDGDVSLNLKKVKTTDSGTYVCNVWLREIGTSKSFSIIYLSVIPGEPEGSFVWMVILIVLLVSSVLVPIFGYLKCKNYI